MPEILKHRIFLAIQIPEDIKKTIEKFLNKLGGATAKLIRFIPKENWHITVSFLGYLAPEEIEILKKILKEETAALQSFILQPERIIWGPHGANKRMIWLDFKKSPEFEKLKNNVENKIISWQNKKSEAGFRYFQNFRKEQRETNIHLTLTRFEPRIFQNIKNMIPVQGIFLKEVSAFEAKNIDIMESRLSKTGPEYKKIFRAEI